MDTKEYDEELYKLINRHRDAKAKLGYDFAISNNPVSNGDVVSNGRCHIKVDNITVAYSIDDEYPRCLYSGTGLKTNLEPYKDERRSHMTQRPSMTVIKAVDL